MVVQDLYIYKNNNKIYYSINKPENESTIISQGFFLKADQNKMFTYDNKNYYITFQILDSRDYWDRDWTEVDFDINKFILTPTQED